MVREISANRSLIIIDFKHFPTIVCVFTSMINLSIVLLITIIITTAVIILITIPVATTLPILLFLQASPELLSFYHILMGSDMTVLE